MNWQDDIRRLEEELAAGRITADEYRTRRDVLLAQSAAGQAPTPNQAPQNQPPQNQPPQWMATPPAQPGVPDSTQVLQQRGNPNATQYVQPGTGPQPTPDYGGENTQIVSGIGNQQQQQPGGPGMQQGGWTTDQNSAPPWGGAFPPVVGAPGNEPWYRKDENQAWFRQGPEVFGSDNKTRKGRIFGIIGAVVVVVLIVVAIVVFKPFGGKNPQAGGGGGTTTNKPAPTTTPTPTGPLAQLPGTKIPTPVHTFDDIAALGFLTSDEAHMIESGQPTNPYFADIQDGNNKILVVIVEESTPDQAASIAKSLSALEHQYGMKASTEAPTGVYLGTATVSGRSLRRAEYSSGAELVRIDVSGTDATSTDQEVNTVLSAQLERLPADG